MHLESAGHTVHIASDGLQAVEMCMANSYDLIFMDVQMPNRDGLEATRLIRSGCPLCEKKPIVGLTANADETTRLACIEAGMIDIITKPVRRRSLIDAARKWLNRTNYLPDACEQTGGAGMPIDFDEAVNEFGGDRALVSGLIAGFLDNVEAQITALAQALENKDHEVIRQEAHKIRGGAANLAAMPLAHAAENLEDLAQAQQIDEAARQLDILSNEFDRLRTTALQCGYVETHQQENRR